VSSIESGIKSISLSFISSIGCAFLSFVLSFADLNASEELPPLQPYHHRGGDGNGIRARSFPSPDLLPAPWNNARDYIYCLPQYSCD